MSVYGPRTSGATIPSRSNSGASNKRFLQRQKHFTPEQSFSLWKTFSRYSGFTHYFKSVKHFHRILTTMPPAWRGNQAPSPRAGVGLTPLQTAGSPPPHISCPRALGAQMVHSCRKEGGPGPALTKRSQRAGGWRIPGSSVEVVADPALGRSISTACAMVMGDGAFATPNLVVPLLPPPPGQVMAGGGCEAQALAGNDPTASSGPLSF